jgi:DNA-binding XRE family transcriptional regulator
VGTVIHYAQGGKAERQQRWARTQRAERLDMYRALQAQGVSQRQAAKVLDVPRTTLQAWRAWQETLDVCPHVGTFFASGPGLAYLHRLVMALHVVFVEIGACGIRLVCLFL